MKEELRQLAETNMNEINALKEQYKGIGVLMHELNYEIFEIIDELGELENNKELLEKLIKVSRMADILEDRLRNKSGEMIERDTVEYLFEKMKSSLFTFSLRSLCSDSDNKPVVSRKDVTKAIKDTLDEMNYIA